MKILIGKKFKGLEEQKTCIQIGLWTLEANDESELPFECIKLNKRQLLKLKQIIEHELFEDHIEKRYIDAG